jgi:uncharacterized membrane protein YraQ (UPF0718 family)
MRNFLRRHSSVVLLGGISLIAGGLVRWLHGPEGFTRAIGATLDIFLAVLPAMLAGLLLAGSLKQLIPSGALAKWMGSESGWWGLGVATVAGMATPGGPMAAFPLVLVLAQAGADRGALIAFIVAWGLNGFQRVLVWEVPLLGADFALLRFLCGLPLGLVAGWLARRVPIAWSPPDTAAPAVAPAAGRRA